MEKLLAILKSIRADIDFENESHLMDDGLLDSFDIVGIVAEVCDEFDISISVEDMEPENFNSVAAMYALIERIQDED